MTKNYLMRFYKSSKKFVQQKYIIIGLILLLFLVNHTVPIFASNIDEDFSFDNVEVTEYEGKDLSSIDNFRENSIKGPQIIDPENYSLTISGLVDNIRLLSYLEVVNNYTSYKKVVTLNCVEGWKVNILWEGILIKDLIAESNVDPNATTIIFRAYDGYSTSLPLDYILDNNIMLAYKVNNVTLPPERGFPFQLVAESKWGYKWIKWITEINLSSNDEYKGFWESRGYSNEGDLNAGFFGSAIPEFPLLNTLLVLIIATIVIIFGYRRRIHNYN